MKSPVMKQHLKTNGLSPYKGTIDTFLKTSTAEIKQKAEEIEAARHRRAIATRQRSAGNFPRCVQAAQS